MAPLPELNLLDRRVFIANLQFVHALIIASEPLLEIVISRAEGALLDFYREHLKEERGHAAWMAEDLRALDAEPCFDWNAAQIAGTQYYIAHHAPPAWLLGYMAALETRPANLEVIEKLEAAHGKQALRTVRHHAEHDPDHGKRILAVIDSFNDPGITQNAMLTSQMLAISLGAL